MKNVFNINIIPDNDVERVKALDRYCIMNTPKEAAFDSIVELAKVIFRTPIAHLSFLNKEEEYIKASVGLGDMLRVDRGESVCAITILNSELTVIENAAEDPLFDNHPYVHGPFGLRFYAGAPLKTSDGYTIGTLCLVDTQPRTVSEHDKEILLALAKVAMEQTELRLANIQETEKQVAINDKLGASEQRLQSILDTMAEGVGIVNLEGQMVYANSMAQRILGLTESDIIERKFDDLKWQNLRVDGTPLPKDDHPMTVMLRTGLPVYDQEIAIQNDKGERTYISINAAPINDPVTGQLTGGIGTFMDVTNRRKLLQQKEEFISIASHELKTPVTSLKASLQMLERMKDDLTIDRLNKLVAQSNKSLMKLSGLIGDLLDANRISHGQWQIHKIRFTMGDFLADCCQHVRTAGKHNIIVNGDLDAEVYADQQQIDQVLVNLVNNAVKYAPESKDLVIQVEKLPADVKISVIDTGPGISPDKLPHLFERYYRADYSGLQFSGLGLGLYISKEIIQKHGGQIGVETELGKGSTFWFTLPLHQA
ncbi:PAS domain S-box protein [Mucilaginibacter sp. Bleaf8]|uniref:ATP-binding protein n=1 Tax=Mucilaginibacter sp. Bleaf8 TaxID=2834430 RepID=UPI001BCF6534|nr:ATP-binding protein [Mucilaginibacter sp. Bleaf8]MBS7565742.1 PAS domain S-box protein [Mucilaginibacter sp. Bleaf8]